MKSKEVKKYGDNPSGLIEDYFSGIIPFSTVSTVITYMNENRKNMKNWGCRCSNDRIMDLLLLILDRIPLSFYVNFNDKVYRLCSHILKECQFTQMDLTTPKVLKQYKNGLIDIYKMLFDFGFKLDYYTFTMVRDHIGSNLSYEQQKKSSKLYRYYMKNLNDSTKQEWDRKWKEEDKRSFPLFYTKKQIKKQLAQQFSPIN